MPKINFNFEGWINGTNITQAHGFDDKGKMVLVDVSDMPVDELVTKLKSGDLLLTLGNHLYNDHEAGEIKILDFEPSDF